MAGNPKRREQMADMLERLEELCDNLQAGMSDRAACEAMGYSNHVLYALVKRNNEAADRVARAREAGADAMASAVVELADDLTAEKKADPVQVAKLRMDSRKWLAGKRSAKYAETRGANVAVQVNVQALHLQAAKAAAPALPAPDVVDVEAIEVLPAPVATLADIL